VSGCRGRGTWALCFWSRASRLEDIAPDAECCQAIANVFAWDQEMQGMQIVSLQYRCLGRVC
jgi:hypothetical protein